MNDPKCAWCGKRLGPVFATRIFCNSTCEMNYECWTGAHLLKRRDAVERWRVGPKALPSAISRNRDAGNRGFRR